ncbi:serine hydrolase [Maribacter sp. 4U21]|nr:serine hydrolase [Maribacter sp. 4U21]
MKSKLTVLIILIFTLASCKSGKKTTKFNSSSKTFGSLQNIVEKNIYRIDKNGKSDSLPITIETRMEELNVPGISIAVFDNNKIIWAKGFGIKNKKTQEKVQENTLFQAASISKPVASVTTFKLVEQGKISLDEDVNLKLENWKIPENLFTTKEKVTASRIMSHTSGLGTSGFQGYNRKSSIPSLVQVLEGSEITNSEPVRVIQTPGESELYSGGGMEVLQLLIEDVSGQKFPKLTEKLIFEPLKMKNSSFNYPLPRKLSALTSNGYDSNGKVIDGGYHIYPEKAAAGLWTTSSDLAKFMIALGKSYRGESGGVLTQSSAIKMLERVPNAGGTGIGIDGKGEAFRFRHSGGNAGFNCYAVSFANMGRGVVIMTNSDNGFPLNHEIVRAISKTYNWPAMWMRE